METIKNLDRAVQNVDQNTLLFLATRPKDERAMSIAETIRTFELQDLAKAFKP